MIPCDHVRSKWISLERLLLAAAVVATYALIPGPLIWLNQHGYLSKETYEPLVAPLDKMHETYPPVEPFYDWYMPFWDPFWDN